VRKEMKNGAGISGTNNQRMVTAETATNVIFFSTRVFAR